MLILTRKAGETIAIGNDVKITILSDAGSQVKIGIEAPKDVTILRSELAPSDDKRLKRNA